MEPKPIEELHTFQIDISSNNNLPSVSFQKRNFKAKLNQVFVTSFFNAKRVVLGFLGTCSFPSAQAVYLFLFVEFKQSFDLPFLASPEARSFDTLNLNELEWQHKMSFISHENALTAYPDSRKQNHKDDPGNHFFLSFSFSCVCAFAFRRLLSLDLRLLIMLRCFCLRHA